MRRLEPKPVGYGMLSDAGTLQTFRQSAWQVRSLLLHTRQASIIPVAYKAAHIGLLPMSPMMMRVRWPLLPPTRSSTLYDASSRRTLAWAQRLRH